MGAFIIAPSLPDCSFNFAKAEEDQSRHGLEQHEPGRGEPSPRGRTEQQRDQHGEFIELEFSNYYILLKNFLGKEAHRLDQLSERAASGE